MTATGDIVRTVLGHYPDTQAISIRLLRYRKRMAGQRRGHRSVVAARTGENQPHAGDEPIVFRAGIATRKGCGSRQSARRSTVFQKEIIAADRRIHRGMPMPLTSSRCWCCRFFRSSAKNGPRSWRKACAAVGSITHESGSLEQEGEYRALYRAGTKVLRNER